MAAKTHMNKYLIEASFQTKYNTVHDLRMEVEAIDGQAVYNILKGIEKEEEETMLHAKVRMVDTDTGESIVVRPKPQTSQQLLPYTPLEEEPEVAPWYKTNAFGDASMYVDASPCTYKEEDES